MYSPEIRQKAKILREKNGRTHREIAKKLSIALGTACLWTKGIILTKTQKKAIEERRNKGCFIPSSMFTEKEREKRKNIARKNLTPFQFKEKYKKTDLIQRIINFYKNNGGIPLKREFGGKAWLYQFRFGSWNNAIQSAGFVPNPVIFSKKCIAKDGHICDSCAEKIIDDWLFKYQIKHEKNFPYKNTKMTADFSIENKNIIVEYFGLAGDGKLYDQGILRKRKFCQRKGLKLIEVYPSDLLPNRLSQIINLKELRN